MHERVLRRGLQTERRGHSRPFDTDVMALGIQARLHGPVAAAGVQGDGQRTGQRSTGQTPQVFQATDACLHLTDRHDRPRLQ